MKAVKIRKRALVEITDQEMTNIYCALIVYTAQLSNPLLKEASQKQLDECAVIMREFGM